MRDVHVTGMGAVTACGFGTETLWAACRDGVSSVRPVDIPDLPRQRVKSAAVLSTDAEIQLADIGDKRMQDRVTRLALAATEEALDQAGLAGQDLGPRCGVFLGVGFGGAETLNRNYLDFSSGENGRLDPMSVPKTMANSTAFWVSKCAAATGPQYTISTACASASQAIGLASHLIRSGTIDRAIVGGAEACIAAGIFRAWEALRVMTQDICRPFSPDRNGMVLGEGAAILILEAADLPDASAQPLALLAGYGTTSDASNLLRPDAKGAAQAMHLALQDARISHGKIGYVSAHGTGTIANDVEEGRAMNLVFNEGTTRPPISSTKPVHGHSLGAVGAIESVVSICALRDGVAPPNINAASVDPNIDVDLVLGEARNFSAPSVLTNSLAFGGVNASLIFSRL